MIIYIVTLAVKILMISIAVPIITLMVIVLAPIIGILLLIFIPMIVVNGFIMWMTGELDIEEEVRFWLNMFHPKN